MAKPYDWRTDIGLPPLTAAWVLTAHAYALLVPLVLITAVLHHWEALQGLADYPLLLLVAAGLMMAGSAFEVAQNTIDRWYLTPETASANGTGLCDLLFYLCIVASQAAVAIAFAGEWLWLQALCVLAVLIFPVLYVKQFAHFAPLGLTGLLAAAVAWYRLGDPIVLLQLVLSPLTMLFFGCLLRTGAQVLHGFTTAAASSGVLFLAAGIHGGTTGTPMEWTTVAFIVADVVVLALVLRPLLLKLPATPAPG